MSPFTLYCCYFSSTKVDSVIKSQFKSDIKKLCSHNSGDFVVCGDFNARHTQWGCVRANPIGNILFQELTKSYFDIRFPARHTYYPASGKGCSSTLDLILTNISQKLKQIEVSHDLASDHLAVLFNIESDSILLNNNNQALCFSKANWPKFQQIINSHISLSSTTMSDINTSSQIDLMVIDQ